MVWGEEHLHPLSCLGENDSKDMVFLLMDAHIPSTLDTGDWDCLRIPSQSNIPFLGKDYC